MTRTGMQETKGNNNGYGRKFGNEEGKRGGQSRNLLSSIYVWCQIFLCWNFNKKLFMQANSILVLDVKKKLI